MRHNRGFSLIEMVMIIVLMGIASVPLMAMFGRSVGSQGSDVAIQTAAQLVQACGEQVLGIRRRQTNGYGLITTTSCSTLTAPAGYSLAALTVTDPYTGGACPAGATCKRVQITASGPNGITASGDLVLVSYI
jgi:type II secretory pathway pseudopilin PulG